jgi:hypothetical protein
MVPAHSTGEHDRKSRPFRLGEHAPSDFGRHIGIPDGAASPPRGAEAFQADQMHNVGGHPHPERQVPPCS